VARRDTRIRAEYARFNMQSLRYLLVCVLNQMNQCRGVRSTTPTATTKPLLTCGNTATRRALRALTATRAGRIGTSDGLLEGEPIDPSPAWPTRSVPRTDRSICGRSLRITAFSPSETPVFPASSSGSKQGSRDSLTTCGIPYSTSPPGIIYGSFMRRRRLARPLVALVHSAKQEITETEKFLVWLHETYQRTAATCTQQDVDEWLATGPTTRSAIRSFSWSRRTPPQQPGHDPAPT
jgi:hypothetical protein